ncbi:ABC transporter permease [Marinifilum sp.]|uniref:ABC transporter permease n=1 Tax=Marinifilum sp. TaxID=2033137 RepID=UPI003BA9233A
MFWYKLKLSIRSLANDKINSFINIFGLAVGMAAVILISIYVQHELSYDKFNKKYERTFKLLSLMNDAGKELVPHEICFRLTPDNFSNQHPEIEELTQLLLGFRQDVKVDDKTFNGIACLNSDTNIHKIFSFEVIAGNPKQVFTSSNSVVITKSTAQKLFGKTDVVGKDLKIHGSDLVVSSVIEDLPKTSHFEFEVLLPFTAFPNRANSTSVNYHTYILFKDHINLPEALSKTKSAYAKIMNDAFGEYGEKTDARLQNLTDIHLRSDYYTDLKPSGDINTVYVHILLACLILIVAIINFINIITVQYEGKINQIGVKKALGAERIHLIKDFLGKSLFMASIALVIGIIISEILLPHFANLMNRNLQIDYLNNQLLFIGLPILALSVGIISGLYPSIVISKYNPSLLVRGISSGKGNVFSKSLVIFQFVTSIVLVSAVVISQQQIYYMKKADLGYNTEQVIAINNLSKKQRQSYEAIKQELLKNPKIQNVSASDHFPNGEGSGQMFVLDGLSDDHYKTLNEYRVHPDYFKTLGIEFVEGKPFEEANFETKNGIIINETAAKYLDTKSPLGSIVHFHGEKYEIQGIVKDFHNFSLKDKIAPLMFSKSWYMQLILIKIKGKDITNTIDEVKKTFNSFDPEQVNFHVFIDDRCRNQYQKEERSHILILSSSALSILLALLGLYALTLFMVQKRTKEIGIRKVSGASMWQITSLLFSTFGKWLLIAFVIAIPIAWYIMQYWLEGFAYRIEIGILPFIIAGIVTGAFALLTVGRQTWKAANQNPIESLRYE